MKLVSSSSNYWFLVLWIFTVFQFDPINNCVPESLIIVVFYFTCILHTWPEFIIFLLLQFACNLYTCTFHLLFRCNLHILMTNTYIFTSVCVISWYTKQITVLHIKTQVHDFYYALLFTWTIITCTCTYYSLTIDTSFQKKKNNKKYQPWYWMSSTFYMLRNTSLVGPNKVSFENRFRVLSVYK